MLILNEIAQAGLAAFLFTNVTVTTTASAILDQSPSESVSSADQEGVATGEKAVDFSLSAMDDTLITLSDFKGKPVILEWTNHDCPYVQKHYTSGNMQKTQRALTEEGVVWLSIVSSAPGKQGYVTGQEAEKIMTSRGSYADTVLLDPDGTVGRLYRARTTPQMILIDAEGFVRYQGAIDDKPSANPASLEGAENYVLNAWEALKKGELINPSTTTPYGCSVKY